MRPRSTTPSQTSQKSLGTTQASSNLGQMVVRAPVGPSSTTAAITPPETTIWVTKDLLLNATVLDEIATNNVTFSLVNQDFEVPEPMSLGPTCRRLRGAHRIWATT